MVKVRVRYSDGVSRGTYLKLRMLNATHDRNWSDPSDPGITLWDWKGSWLQLSLPPDWDREDGSGDRFEERGQALMLTPREAVAWLRERGINPPPDLEELAGRPFSFRRLFGEDAIASDETQESRNLDANSELNALSVAGIAASKEAPQIADVFEYQEVVRGGKRLAVRVSLRRGAVIDSAEIRGPSLALLFTIVKDQSEAHPLGELISWQSLESAWLEANQWKTGVKQKVSVHGPTRPMCET